MKNNHANNQVNNVAVANNKKVQGFDVLSLTFRPVCTQPSS